MTGQVSWNIFQNEQLTTCLLQQKILDFSLSIQKIFDFNPPPPLQAENFVMIGFFTCFKEIKNLSSWSIFFLQAVNFYPYKKILNVNPAAEIFWIFSLKQEIFGHHHL